MLYIWGRFSSHRLLISECMMMTSSIMVRTMDNGQVSYDYGQWLILPEIQNHKERFIWAVDDINLMLVSKNYGDVY